MLTGSRSETVKHHSPYSCYRAEHLEPIGYHGNLITREVGIAWRSGMQAFAEIMVECRSAGLAADHTHRIFTENVAGNT